MISIKPFAFLLCLPFISSHRQGESLHREKRVIYGKSAGAWYYNYQIAIEENKINICSGALLSREWGTSAAVCLAGKKKWRTTMKARIGSGIREKGGSEHNLSKAFIHSEFNATTLLHNILLFKFLPIIRYGANREPINIAGYYDVYKVGTFLNVSGWGASDESDKFPYFLKTAPMEIVNSDNCSKMYAKGFKNKDFKIHKTQMCLSSSKSATCIGDAGAPAVYNFKLIGIVSAAMTMISSCRLSLFPTIITNVAKYHYWIRTITKIIFINS